MGKRRCSREWAFRQLFAWDVTGDIPSGWYEFASQTADNGSQHEVFRPYAEFLFRGVISRIHEIDAVVQKHSKRWKLGRMGVVERTILRLATFEMLYSDDVPKAAVINEAVEIAKIYGDKDSPVFINGNLDQVYRCEKVVPEANLETPG